MISSRLIKSNNAAAGCVDIVDAYDPFDGNGLALYQLNGNATDSSPNAYNGTWGGTASYGTGVFGQAAVLNGSNNYINLGNGVSTLGGLFGAKNSFTVSLWFKTGTTTMSDLFSDFATNSFNCIIEMASNGTIDIISRYSGTTYVISSTNSYNDNSWHNVVVTFDSGTNNLNFYVDNIFIASQNTPNAWNGTTNQRVTIGANYYTNASVYQNYFNGSIDQVRIFNEALTPLEVEALYIEESCLCGGTVDTLDILDDSSCIALYPLDGNANDLSGNYSGTPTAVSYGVGEFDLAGVFNGSSSYISASIPFLNARVTSAVSLWIKYTDTGAYKSVFNDYSNTANFNHNIIVNQPSTGNLRFFSAYGGSGGYVTFETNGLTLNDGNWHHIVGTVDVSTRVYKGYVDGVEVGSMTVSSNAWTGTTQNLQIGRQEAGAYFNGSIDQVRIFNKALNSTEVTTLYNETACTKAACTGTTNTLDILGDGSCVATYPLDGSPVDLSGNYNGVQTDVTYPQGYFDLAGSFDGSGDTIDVASISGFPSGNSARTISFWMNSSSYLTGGILGYGAAASNQGFLFYVAGGNLHFTFYGNDVSTSYSLSANQWYNIVATHDGYTFTIYANGSFVNSASRTLNTTATNFRIGGAPWNNGGEFFRGEIDQVRIFNKVLSAGEVTTLYNETPCN